MVSVSALSLADRDFFRDAREAERQLYLPLSSLPPAKVDAPTTIAALTSLCSLKGGSSAAFTSSPLAEVARRLDEYLTPPQPLVMGVVDRLGSNLCQPTSCHEATNTQPASDGHHHSGGLTEVEIDAQRDAEAELDAEDSEYDDGSDEDECHEGSVADETGVIETLLERDRVGELDPMPLPEKLMRPSGAQVRSALDVPCSQGTSRRPVAPRARLPARAPHGLAHKHLRSASCCARSSTTSSPFKRSSPASGLTRASCRFERDATTRLERSLRPESVAQVCDEGEAAGGHRRDPRTLVPTELALAARSTPSLHSQPHARPRGPDSRRSASPRCCDAKQ